MRTLGLVLVILCALVLSGCAIEKASEASSIKFEKKPAIADPDQKKQLPPILPLQQAVPTQEEKDLLFQKGCLEVLHQMEIVYEASARILAKQNGEEVAPEVLRKRVDNAILLNAKIAVNQIQEAFAPLKRPEGYTGEVPIVLDVLYAMAHHKEADLTNAIEMGYDLNKAKTNILAGLALTDSPYLREPFLEALKRIRDWDKRLISLAISESATEKSAEHYEKFYDFWKARQAEKMAPKPTVKVDAPGSESAGE